MKTTTITTAIDGITPQAVAGSAANLVPPGSILVVTRSGILAHSFPAAVNVVEVTVNQDLKALTPLPGLSCEYIRLALKGFERAILNECVKDGTTVHSIELPALMGFEIPLPPLPEQHRIVAKIEALFSELDAGQDSLTRAQAQLKLYRQSLLKAAFQGRLTADWRAANPDKLETPETLLSRIRSERDARYKQALDDWQHALSEWRAGGEVGRKPGKPSRLPDLSLSPEQEPGPPSGWITVTVEGLLFEPLSNGRSVKDRAGGFPVLRLSAFNSGRLDLSAWKPGAWTSDEAAPWLVQEGDFFAARGNGSKHLVGIGALAVGVSEPVAYPDTMIRISLDRSVVAPEYFLFVWNSRVMRDQIESAARTTAGIYKINQPHICAFTFPLPPREEQDAILNKLSPTLSQVEYLETEITTALAKITALRQSILKQAFSGRLVPQDPADEPASALLARLRATAPPARAKRKTPA
jgi:type I restriction enzyme S subunit